jgi:hypothetical protein
MCLKKNAGSESYLHFFLLYIFERTIDAGELDLVQRLVKLGVSWTLGIVQSNFVFQNTTQSLIHFFVKKITNFFCQ